MHGSSEHATIADQISPCRLAYVQYTCVSYNIVVTVQQGLITIPGSVSGW